MPATKKMPAQRARNTSQSSIQFSAMSAFEKNFKDAASSTKPMNTLSVFIQAPALGIFARRPGTSARKTKGVAIVSPKKNIPIAIFRKRRRPRRAASSRGRGAESS